MGVDKAALPWGSGTFLQAVASKLDMFTEKYLSVSFDAGNDPGVTVSDLYGISPDWQVLPDKVPDCGPIGGIYSALSSCSALWVMAVSCDVPGMEESLLRVLMTSRTADAEIIYPVTSDGQIHLTCALYRKSVLTLIERQIREKDYKIRTLLKRCSAVAVPLDSARDSFLEKMLVNINTREDFQKASAASEGNPDNHPFVFPPDPDRHPFVFPPDPETDPPGSDLISDRKAPPSSWKGSRDFYLWDDGIRIHCRLDLPDHISIDPGPECSDSRLQVPKLPLMILFHGFTGHMEEDHIRAVAETANESGYAVLRAELYGHGRSGGDFRDHTLLKWISNALTVTDYARSLPFVSGLFMCGHSQGGLLTMLAGAMEEEHLEAILPLSPAWMIPETARRGDVLGTLFDPMHVPERIAAGKGLCLGGRYIRTAQSIEVEPSIRKFQKPVLIVHGSADLSVPVDYSVRASE